MSRRIALPGADELFRSTGGAEPARSTGTEDAAPAAAPAAAPPASAVPAAPRLAPVVAPPQVPDRADQVAGDLDVVADDRDDALALEQAAATVRSAPRRRARAVAERRPSGRERHDEKITVYVSPDELMDLEHARLTLRGDFGLSVDRGRVVREALAVVLADLEAKGEASILVRRLRGR
jgi:hypothetical protein